MGVERENGLEDHGHGHGYDHGNVDGNVNGNTNINAKSPTSSLPLWRAVLHGFTSQWFLVPQGTGIVAVILHQLDWRFSGLTVISYLFWVATIVSLLCMIAMYALRCILFPRHVLGLMRDGPDEMDGLTSICIAFTSILQMAALSISHPWGHHWSIAIYSLWWFNVALVIVANVVIYYTWMKHFPPGIDKITPATLLPLIAALTAAAGAGTICQGAQLSAGLQVPAIIVGFLLVGMGIPLALSIDVLYLIRTLDRPSAPRSSPYQDMILCGPWGQGGFALQILGKCILKGEFAEYARGTFLTDQAGNVVGYVSILLGLMAWGFASFWWAFAIISLLTGWRRDWPYLKSSLSLKPWALVFPWGVYTNSALELGKLLDSTAFRAWSTILAVGIVILWLGNVARTLRGLVMALVRRKHQD